MGPCHPQDALPHLGKQRVGWGRGPRFFTGFTHTASIKVSMAPKLCSVVQFGTNVPTRSDLKGSAGVFPGPWNDGRVTSTTCGFVNVFTTRQTTTRFSRVPLQGRDGRLTDPHGPQIHVVVEEPGAGRHEPADSKRRGRDVRVVRSPLNHEVRDDVVVRIRGISGVEEGAMREQLGMGGDALVARAGPAAEARHLEPKADRIARLGRLLDSQPRFGEGLPLTRVCRAVLPHREAQVARFGGVGESPTVWVRVYSRSAP